MLLVLAGTAAARWPTWGVGADSTGESSYRVGSGLSHKRPYFFGGGTSATGAFLDHVQLVRKGWDRSKPTTPTPSSAGLLSELAGEGIVFSKDHCSDNAERSC
ncbi:hypothetical protein CH63R_07366 [Colletotrichum higginsianum IMI 349063]|uniref:Secreted protein n=2 Tax=Colletotrichum higginsianum TaxID=80884 RepID=A0A1B7Y942_COLHI|nr:hypothetical protein CH63R_07366 [Colletotrichum higginsianum IMI 349063]OBR08601.1 hypothetical protein CH63R_07366 [Colletotrichum higginsianum IMI 349063]TIC95293.1 hypothetical protein CH35J_008713 [Colletotrichum higginsianum]